MEAVRKVMHEAIEQYGLGSIEALEASQKLDKHIAVAQKQRVLTKAEFMSKVIKDLDKKKYEAKKNEADLYLWDKGRMAGTKVAKHKQRQPYWRAK